MAAWLPRARGDGPADTAASAMRPLGFPAHAGMDRVPVGRLCGQRRLPRARGDGPTQTCDLDSLVAASPRTRGWTPGCPGWAHAAGGFPAHAGMDPPRFRLRASTTRLPRARGDGPNNVTVNISGFMASPRTRGWTPDVGRHEQPVRGFPAHAGMDPHRRFVGAA